MKRKRIILAVVTTALVLASLLSTAPLTGTTAPPIEGYGYGGSGITIEFLPPPPAPPPGILYDSIIHSEPLTVVDATRALNWAKNIHQSYLDNPWRMNSYTGGAAWHEQWVYLYADINNLLVKLEENQGQTRTIMIVVTGEGTFVFEQ